MSSSLTRAIDRTIEATVVLSFSNIGYRVRSRLDHWAATPSLAGRHVVVTGATSGLGLEAAAAFAQAGAHVYVVARNPQKAEVVIAELRERIGRDAFTFVEGDMGSLESVRRCAATLREVTDTIDVLVHNAGALTADYTRSPDGTETTLATHVVGPFLLTELLRGPLANAAPGRVITVTSGGMYSWKFSLPAFEMTPTNYDGVKAYAHAKRAQVMLAHEWADLVSPSQILFATMHPGWSDTPGLASSLPTFYRLLRPYLRTPAEGMDTALWLASTPDLADNDGALYFDRRVRSEHKMRTRSATPTADQRALWRWCVERSGVSPTV